MKNLQFIALSTLCLSAINIRKIHSHEINSSLNRQSIKIQPLVPIISINDKCPIGFQKTSGYCIPYNSNTRPVIPIYTGIKASGCPMGFGKNNGYCQLFKGVEMFAIPKVKSNCPQRFFSNGDYCIQQ